MKDIFHSVKLIEEKCKGCTKCMIKCPVEAVRVKNSRALIYTERCIDCGECIRVCSYNAHVAIRDDIEDIKKYKIKAAIPSAVIYSQFGGIVNPETINKGIISLGFDDVFDITYACDIVSEIVKKEIANTPRPAISSFCPAIVRLIQTRYPGIINNVVRVVTPIEVSSCLLRDKYLKMGYKNDEIGIFYLTPCVARISGSQPVGTEGSQELSGVIAISDIYPALLKYVGKTENQSFYDDSTMSFTGLSWAVKGGQSRAMGIKEYLAVDGVENVKRLLEEIERGKFKDALFIEAFACTEGCLGGLMLVENPYNARRVISKYHDILNYSYMEEEIKKDFREQFLADYSIINTSSQKFSEDFHEAVSKMKHMNYILNMLPGTDCGQCGSPSCRAFAEDVARGLSTADECKFIKMEE